MKQTIKLVLTVIALCVLALPVKAVEKVWYCDMIGHSGATAEGDKVYKLEKFKMKVTKNTVVFGSGGIFDDFTLPITDFVSHDYWFAGNEFSTAHFRDNLFLYGSVLGWVTAVSARCDDF